VVEEKSRGRQVSVFKNSDGSVDIARTVSNKDGSPDYLHIHILRADQLETIVNFVQALSNEEGTSKKENILYQWGTPNDKLLSIRRSIYHLEEIKEYGQVGIGSASVGIEEDGNYCGGGEAIHFGSKSYGGAKAFRITKGNNIIYTDNDQMFWTHHFADFHNMTIHPFNHDNLIKGRDCLMQLLKSISEDRPFVATFDAVFEGPFYSRSNGILKEDPALHPQSSVFVGEDAIGGHLIGGNARCTLSSVDGDVSSMKEFGLTPSDTDFSVRIVSDILLKPIFEVRIMQEDGTFRNPQTESEVM
jgi:hypothetical protein